MAEKYVSAKQIAEQRILLNDTQKYEDSWFKINQIHYLSFVFKFAKCQNQNLVFKSFVLCFLNQNYIVKQNRGNGYHSLTMFVCVVIEHPEAKVCSAVLFRQNNLINLKEISICLRLFPNQT